MKKLYAIKKDGEYLNNCHLFIFEHELSAIMTLLLFSISFACKDLKMYCLGVFENSSDYPLHPAEPIYVCCYYDSLDKASLLLSNLEDCPITMEYLKGLYNDVDVSIQKKFMLKEEDTYDAKVD